jgi:hypothetical protein
MRIILKRMITVLLTLYSYNVFSQSDNNESFKIFSLENKESTVYLKLDVVNERITVQLNPSQTLCINGFKGFEQKPTILNQKFMELQFKIRGGSGVAIRRYVLICISESKLCKAIDVLSMISSKFEKTYVSSIDKLNLYNESSIYKLSFTMSQDDDQNNILVVKQYEKIYSKDKPNKNHETQDVLTFSFDKVNKVFYNTQEDLKGSFDIDDDIGGSFAKKIFNSELYPVIKLRNEEYFFINKNWYIKDGKSHLTEFSCLCK